MNKRKKWAVDKEDYLTLAFLKANELKNLRKPSDAPEDAVYWEKFGIWRSPCYYCKRSPGVTKDHIVPKSKGGRQTVPCCALCNKDKGTLSAYEWFTILKLRGVISENPYDKI